MTKKMPLLLCVVLATSLPGCSRTLPTYRYRLTVEVDTPSGLRTGSSVIEVSGSQNTRFAPGDVAGKINMDARGEAVAVDLPGGKTLFALLRLPGRSEGAAGFAEDALPARIPPGDDGYARRLDALKQRRDLGVLPESLYPMIVTFTDLHDPRSVVLVKPDHLDATFGPGTALRRVTVVITDDAVSTGIEKRLPWLTAKAVMGNPGWRSLPYDARIAINGLFSNTLPVSN